MSISNTDNIIDSRDVIERIEGLGSELDEMSAADCERDKTDPQDQVSDEYHDLHCEHQMLVELAEQGESYAPDWNYGEALIHESYFTEYSKQLCEGIGSIPSDVPAYIADNIDWDGVAEDLKVDYTEVDFDGETYYIR